MQSINTEFSAGGVIIEEGRVLAVFMKTPSGEKVWTFPKGHLEPGETHEAAALREVAEETGFNCVIKGKLPQASYAFTRNGQAVNKTVTWYLMQRTGGDGIIKTPDEISELKWCGFSEAKSKLTYASDLKMLEMLKEKLNK